MSVSTIAGMSLSGGRRDKFYFALVEYYKDSGRAFLKSLLQIKDDEEGGSGDEIIHGWIEEFKPWALVIDFPLSFPSCHDCKLKCPGTHLCEVPSVATVRKEINLLLEKDQKLFEENPKKYEQERNRDDEIEYSRELWDKRSDSHILSRSFKRRLKKGFLPYWNRPVDFWVWKNYYDQLLDIFSISYDSLGHTSLMLMARFDYLKRHIPADLKLAEGNIYITLLELFRKEIISHKELMGLSDIELAPHARLTIIRKIEKSFNLFVYDNDLDILVKKPRAFNSFIMSFNALLLYQGKTQTLPEWTNPKDSLLVVPSL